MAGAVTAASIMTQPIPRRFHSRLGLPSGQSSTQIFHLDPALASWQLHEFKDSFQ